jgi:hypothetical protein
MNCISVKQSCFFKGQGSGQCDGVRIAERVEIRHSSCAGDVVGHKSLGFVGPPAPEQVQVAFILHFQPSWESRQLEPGSLEESASRDR